MEIEVILAKAMANLRDRADTVEALMNNNEVQALRDKLQENRRYIVDHLIESEGDVFKEMHAAYSEYATNLIGILLHSIGEDTNSDYFQMIKTLVQKKLNDCK